MKLFKKALVVGAIVLASAGANAELISLDFEIAGDNLVTLR